MNVVLECWKLGIWNIIILDINGDFLFVDLFILVNDDLIIVLSFILNEFLKYICYG